jgi:hypothetical protein
MAPAKGRPYSGFAREAEGKAEMIYCVIPEELKDELHHKLTEYYKDDPNVEVIIDRRKSERRRKGESGGKRQLRDRRRRRPAGNFPRIDAH